MLLVAIPFLLLIAIELTLRGCGAYTDRIWDNPHVEFAANVRFFPQWQGTVTMPKPIGVLRIFALGGSVTAGLGVETPFAGLLPAALARKGVPQQVEVINGGVSAAGSHRVFEVLKESAMFDPDLVVLCIGNNEFLEDIFFDNEGGSILQAGLPRCLRRLRLTYWLEDCLGLADLSRRHFKRARLQRHFLGNMNFPLIRSPEQYRQKLDFLESNLDAMIRFARSRDIRPLVVPEVANLMTPPGDSATSDACTDPAAFKQTLQRALDMLRTGDIQTAQTALELCRTMDPSFALVRYNLGKLYLREDRLEAARRELEAANAANRRGDTINPDVLEVVRRVCARTETPFVDLRPRFYERPATRSTAFGSELFLDHCHPTAEGHALMAEAMALAIAEKRTTVRRQAP